MRTDRLLLLEGYRISLTGMTTPEVQALFLAGTAGPLREAVPLNRCDPGGERSARDCPRPA